MSVPPAVPPPTYTLFIETFEVTVPGKAWIGEIFRSRSRSCGRRIVIRDERFFILFDTDDCYDLGNAVASLDAWLADQRKESGP